MGFQKKFRPVLQTHGGPVQALTEASTATPIAGHGVTTISLSTGGTADGTLRYQLQAPRPGMMKYIFATVESTKEITIYTASSSDTFFGSTNNGVSFSTDASGDGVVLLGVSNTQWAVAAVTSTEASLVATTAG